MAEPAARKKVTIPMLMEKKKKGEPIVQLAVYDYETAIIADRVGIDILCVSDTGGMVLFGHESTTSVSFEEVMFMAQAVKRGSQYGLRMVDMPYMSFHLSAQQAVDNAAKYVSQGGAEVMKCEGNQHHAKYIEAIVKAGIPVQGHIGICPMRIPQLGGFAAQGKTADRAKELVDDALAFVDAGCFSIMTEVVTSEVSEYLAKTLSVPVKTVKTLTLGSHGDTMVPVPSHCTVNGQPLRDLLPDGVAAIEPDRVDGLDFHGALAATAGDAQHVALDRREP